MRAVAVLLLFLFAAGCYVPPRKAKSCATCSRAKRPASHATHIR